MCSSDLGYGNSIGIPTVGGEVCVAPSYRDNPLCNVLCAGILPVGRLTRARASGVGNLLVLIGPPTGRDGIGGASMASEELRADDELDKRPQVQVGDPFQGKLLVEACLELMERRLVVGVQDLGAAGLTSSVAETAARAGTGAEVQVEQVPRREEGMSAREVMLSESQERMLAVVEPGRVEEVLAVCRRWGLGAAVVGRVTADGRLRVREGDRVVADLPVRRIVGGRHMVVDFTLPYGQVLHDYLA